MKLDKRGYFVTSRSNYTFHDAYIQAHAIELLEEYDFYKHFLCWLPEYRKNYSGYTGEPVLTEIQKRIIIQMIECANPNIQFHGICLAENYRLKEAIPAIKKAASCTLIPDDVFDEEGLLIESSTRSVAEQARIVLKRFGCQIP